jgi:DNA-binding PadR family transcriptional regulator
MRMDNYAKRLPFSLLTIAEYYVLAVLAGRERGAYDLCQIISKESSGAVIISSGHMARLLTNLTNASYVKPEPKVGRVTPYSLTKSGGRRLEQEINKHRRAIIVAEKYLRENRGFN